MKQLYSHVAILGVDGAGAYFTETETPNIDRILQNGAITYEAITSEPSISAECWGSMLHGVVPVCHRLTNGIAGSRPYPHDSIYPSVFRVLHEARPDAVMASFNNWNSINRGIIENDLGVYEDHAGDAELTDKIVSYLDAGNKPELFFLQFDEVDGAGHGHGYGSEKHLESIRITDGYLGRIYDAYVRAGIADDTLFIITADHGGVRGGHSHGGTSPEEMKIMIGVAGKDVCHGRIGEAAVRDIASIALYALGLEQPLTWTGRVPTGIFQGVTAGERPAGAIPQPKYPHDSVPTPENGLKNILGNRLEVYLPFDSNSLLDVTGKHGVSYSGKIYFPEGYHGTSLKLDDGYIEIKDFKPGAGSLSFGFWLKDEGMVGAPVLFTNQNVDHKSYPGFIMQLGMEEGYFSLGNGEDRSDFSFGYPGDLFGSWAHLLFNINEEEKKLFVWSNFNRIAEFDLGKWAGLSRDSEYPFRLGQDARALMPHSVVGRIDDFFVTRDNMTEKDIAALKEYYK